MTSHHTQRGGGSGGHTPRSRTGFKEAIVFVAGGGNYVEYQNLRDFAKRAELPGQPGSGKKITYGSTEILTAAEMLRQLTEVSKPKT